ncbi:MAG TPA: TonB-dependent receptor [Candidatus Koribacter sp.]|jgi:hypothetical protein
MFQKKSWLSILALGFLLAFLTAPALTQQVTATITGTILDPSGAPIVGADVTAVDMEHGVTIPTKTNEQGVYVLPRVPVGSYKLKVAAKGFETADHPPFTLVLNQTARVDVQMKMGQGSEVLEVTAGAPVLQTDTTEISTLIDSKTNEELPLATRNYVQLTLLTPGAVTPDPASMTSGADMTTSGRPYINGNREQANNFMLDGIDNNQIGDNEVGYAPSVDAIEEFNLISQNASAEYGNFQGGIVNTTIKSGTNGFHGDAFEFFRNDVLNANTWADGIPKYTTGELATPKLRWNMFGGTFGGPIIKNKLFFFADYQGQRFDSPASAKGYTLIPTSMRGGDLSSMCPEGFTAGLCNNPANQLYNPYNVVAGQRQPFLGNQIPTGMISSVATNLFKSSYYPGASDLAGGANYFANNSQQYNNDQGDLKIDYVMSTKDRISGRWSEMYLNEPLNSAWALANTGANTTNEPAKNFMVSWDHTFSQSLLNEARVGFNWVGFLQNNSANGVGNLASDLGIGNGNSGGAGMPLLVIGSGMSSIGNIGVLQQFGDTAIQAQDVLIWTHGRHLFHFGFQFSRYRMDSAYAGNAGTWGEMDFGGGFTQSSGGIGGSSIADFLLGTPALIQRGGALGWGQRSSLYAGFIQDDWRITDELTLNLGLRYEHNTPWVETNNHQVNFGLYSGAVEFAGQGGNSDALYNSYNGIGNWQPRVGVAWAPNALRRKTVFRAAYTVSSYAEGMGSNNRLAQNVPFVPSETVQQFSGSGVPTATLTTGFPVAQAPGAYTGVADFAGSAIRLWDPNWRPGMVQQWNVSVQDQITSTITAQVGYVGQHGTHLTNFWWADQRILNSDGTTSPGPFVAGNPALKNEISAIRMTLSNGGSNYQALQASLDKRFSQGLDGQLAYTYSKCHTDAVGFYGNWSASQTDIGMPTPQDIYNPRGDYGYCNFDVASVVSGYFNYDLPFGTNKQFGGSMNRVTNAILGNWSTTGILQYHTGFAMNFVDGWVDPAGTGSFMERPNVTGGISYPQTRTPVGLVWVDPSSFVQASAGHFGNEPVGDIRGPGLATFDFGLHKAFAFGESKRLEFRAEAINLFNHPVLYMGAANMYLYSGNPLTNPLTGAAGVINQSKDERNLQLALKFYF